MNNTNAARAAAITLSRGRSAGVRAYKRACGKVQQKLSERE
jgi:hypothetical protein